MSGLFSKIIAGEIPSFKVFEDDWTFSFLTKDSIHLGHTLIIPKIEVDYFVDVPDPYFTKVFENSRRLARAIHKATKCHRVGTMIAGWEVAHFHYHLVPMFHADDLDFKKARTRSLEENQQMQAAIQRELG